MTSSWMSPTVFTVWTNAALQTCSKMGNNLSGRLLLPSLPPSLLLLEARDPVRLLEAGTIAASIALLGSTSAMRVLEKG